MKRFLAYITLVLLAVIGVMIANDSLNRVLVMSSVCSDVYKMKRLFVSAPEDEIPILGSSRAEVCIAPKELSSRAFSYGQGGSLFRETVFQLKFVLKKPGSKLIVVNLDPWGLHAGTFRCDYRFVADVQAVKSEPNIVLPWSDRIPGLRFYGELRKNLTMGIRSGSSTKVLEQGAVLSKVVRSESDWTYIKKNLEVKSFFIDDETWQMLQEVLTGNASHEVVFVVPPIIAEWWAQFEGGGEFDRLKARLRDFQHVHVIDWRELGVNFDLSDFLDPTHLNERGARKFTRALKCVSVDCGLLRMEDKL